ncbi:MAG: hypothetical protein LBH60_05425 [Prevotellaceae bacterium]|jgi:DNA-binding CsgD family transcriptional regulator|nr:hypothetical protein [Prevotellaceae bacterium]
MNQPPLTYCEREAVLYLAEYEVIKVAAYKRKVSEHTQKNQIKSAMAKLGVCTQVGLIKEFFRLAYNIQFSIKDVRQMLAVFLLILAVISVGNTDTFARRARGRRNETEYVCYYED